MVKIAHFSDLHIKNLKHHSAYKQMFEKFMEELKKSNPDYVLFLGDWAHSKNQISCEFYDLSCDFLKTIGDNFPFYIILGNHDFSVRSIGRQDAVSPIIKALNHPNIHLLKFSGETEIGDNIILNVYSLLDKEKWTNPSNPEKINICLYHGAVKGIQTDSGWVSQNGIDPSIFDKFDFVMLGDIHKANQVLDKEGRVRYSGSTIQQNFGETDDKGFLIWEIEDKNTFSVKQIIIPNPQPFITLELTKKGRIPKETKIPENSRIRLVSENNLPYGVMKRAIEIASSKFKPESISFLNRLIDRQHKDKSLYRAFETEDLRNIQTQEKLIEEYLKDYEIDKETLQRVKDLNKKYKEIVEGDEEIIRNVFWRIKKLNWDNLFNYGENNEINFNNLNGIVGIFGKSYSGKSSIVENLIWTIFNSTSKNERKNYNVINQNKNKACGYVEIEIDDKTYTILRTAEKYEKRLKGETTLEAKTELEFNSTDIAGREENLNGITRNDTDKNIRRIFGTIEDFLLTSMSSQFGALSYINEGSTKRKEILAKFLDLEVFDRKFKIAKEDISELKASLKKFEGREFDEEVKKEKQKIEENNYILQEKKSECELLNNEIETIRGEIEEVKNHLRDNDINVEDFLEDYDYKKSVEEENKWRKKKEEIENRYLDFYRLEVKLEKVDERQLKQKAEKEKIIKRKAREFHSSLQETKFHYENNKKKCHLLNDVPCGDKFPDCKFICDAHKARKENVCLNETIKKQEKEKEEILSSHSEVSGSERNYSEFLEEKNRYSKLKEKLSREKEELNKHLPILESKNRFYEEKFEDYEEKIHQLKEKQNNFKKCNDEILELYRKQGYLEQSYENLVSQKEEMLDLRQQYQAYDLFLRCFHSDGIGYEIIKKQLPVINEEIAKILVNVVDFEVYFENNGRKLDIFIKHPKYAPRPLELGSGAERILASMAIRLALIKVSNLPKSNVFILDEVGSQFDQQLLQNFISMLDTLKENFETIILISHLDALKDCANTTIEIEKENGFAKVSI